MDGLGFLSRGIAAIDNFLLFNFCHKILDFVFEIEL
jgi:hypothetical protein